MRTFTDGAIAEIRAHLADHPPERGGALLGPADSPAITRFVFDDEAETTGATYGPSRHLNRRVKDLERHEGLQLKGIVHSHPGTMDQPSGQDLRELRVGLDINPHLPDYALPIVTCERTGPLGEHEIALGAGKLSFYLGTRQRGGDILLEGAAVRVLPVEQPLDASARALGGRRSGPVTSSLADGVPVLTGTVTLANGAELILLFGDGYPLFPPLAIHSPVDGDAVHLGLAWNLALPEAERLPTALAAAVASRNEPPGFGPPGSPALTADRARARRAGWGPRPRQADRSPQDAASSAAESLFARSHGLLSEQVRGRSVVIAGLGSVGSDLAEELCRSGVDRFVFIDPETVEPDNLCRSRYDLEDVGSAKVVAIERRLLNINPTVTVDGFPRDVQGFPPAELAALVQGADLVVGATDSPKAQRTLDRFAYAYEKPGIYVGLYAGARGGEVVASLPGRTPCFACATAVRHGIGTGGGGDAGQIDYGSGRLVGEVALGADIHHVTSAAAKIALALLTPAADASPLTTFLDGATGAQLSYLTLSMHPDYWFYPAVFGEAPGQYAYQAVWLTPQSRPDCSVCGDPRARRDPRSISVSGPNVRGLAARRARRAGRGPDPGEATAPAAGSATAGRDG